MFSPCALRRPAPSPHEFMRRSKPVVFLLYGSREPRAGCHSDRRSNPRQPTHATTPHATHDTQNPKMCSMHMWFSRLEYTRDWAMLSWKQKCVHSTQDRTITIRTPNTPHLKPHLKPRLRTHTTNTEDRVGTKECISSVKHRCTSRTLYFTNQAKNR